MNLIAKLIRRVINYLNYIPLYFKIKFWHILYGNRLHISSKLGPENKFLLMFDASKSSIFIDEGCQFRSNNRINSGNNGHLIIEKNVFFNSGCSINCLHSIKIGANSQFGENVCLYDHNHRYSDLSRYISDQGYSFGEIKIGSNTWIGSNVTILKGVEIGDNVVIGAGCIIHKSIPSNTIIYNKQELVQKELSN
jgi:acetyltransferase-like isoleucine patch superfamily enzyme